MPRVLHVIQQLSRGGAGRALLGVATTARRVEHRVLSLAPAAEQMRGVARERGVDLVDAPGEATVERELEAADIVHVHFWNTPELHELLTGGLPPVRLLVWVHVAGDSPPHVLTRELVELGDVTVASTPYTAELPIVENAALTTIPPAIGWAHLDGLESKPHAGFNVGYVGTVDFAKLHPDFVGMSARVDAPDARFVVCGSGDGFATLARQAEALGVRDRFDLRGYVDDVRGVLAELDVFGYPLRPGNYSATELVLQEAMYACVPPVVMAHGGAQRTVEHGRTGLVAIDEDAYVRAIERLHADPRERARLGHAARDHAIRAWSPAPIAERWNALYDDLLAGPKRPRDPTLSAATPGAARFVESLGEGGRDFRASLLGSDLEQVLAAERRIAAAPPAVASADSGGVLHYRRRYPDDPQLRLWSGLVLAAQGRHALAAGELAGATQRGFEHWRASMYLAESARALGQPQLAEQAISRLPDRYAARLPC